MKKIILIFCIIVFCIICGNVTYIMINDYMEFKENDNVISELIEETVLIDEETKQISAIDWNYLKSVNSDIIAWIEIEGTSINYPILKDKDLYYMNHNFEKKYSKSGSIFIQEQNPFETIETIIYGHNMRNDSMFSNLTKYINKEYFENHLKIKIYTPENSYEGKIFSAYSIGIKQEENNIEKLSDIEKIEYYKNASKYKIETDKNIEKIVKLSTCSYINAKVIPTDQRFFVIASLKKIE